MNEKLPVTAVILTYNEQKNLRTCLDSLSPYIAQIIIMDSFSQDNTLDIAREYTTHIYQHKFENHALQFNYALAHCEFHNEWIFRVDADERMDPHSFVQLQEIITDPEVMGISLRKKIYFMGKWIRFGGYYPNHFVRLFRKGKGAVENRWMDEHVQVHGKVFQSKIDIIEANYDREQNISLWTTKHNDYATREAVGFLKSKYNLGSEETIARLFGTKTERKRWFKEKAYYITPLHFRAFIYFIYRYFLLLGFLDGYRGFIYHLLQAFWYRFLVDTKIYQFETLSKKKGTRIQDEIVAQFPNFSDTLNTKKL